ncbi:hypothetical protein H7992_09600 [Sporosarcina sp. resist]|uniref:hypothetical protein n=1 Tax=Sporosarcina sp. resist TaxID=2762563 RepID=UPI00164D6685|nr:hypothetical protein [Sporosarcina sp. resist]QNK89872.1 hypothetical protein H7992_09600 [Sporosarcina sp. resist]
MAKIITFKTRQQLETEKATKVVHEWEAHLEWEEANWYHVIEKEIEEEQSLSLEEIEWLKEWIKKDS